MIDHIRVCAIRGGRRAAASFERYVERTGKARVPRLYEIDSYRLGAWIMAQRDPPAQRHPGRRPPTPTLRPSRPTWEPHVGRWEEGFSRLQEYLQHHGDARVPVSYVVDGYRLGEWVHQQRKNYKNGILDADRQQRLQELPGWTWDASADRGSR